MAADHFENIARTLLEAEGYWVAQSFKVNVTKEEKRQIGKHSIPRPEIDLLALHFARNEVLAVETKSYLDSPGAKASEIQATHAIPEGRYKLFTCENYRRIVLSRLKADLLKLGMANDETKIRLGLIIGNVYPGDSLTIRRHSCWSCWGGHGRGCCRSG